MDTQNNIKQTIDEKVTEFTKFIEEIGGDAIVVASHNDIGWGRSALYGSRLNLIDLVMSSAKADKDILNILKIALSLMEKDQTTEATGATKAEVLPTTTLPS